jgi:hypothetical protein
VAGEGGSDAWWTAMRWVIDSRERKGRSTAGIRGITLGVCQVERRGVLTDLKQAK